jgi:hypothetical protein
VTAASDRRLHPPVSPGSAGFAAAVLARDAHRCVACGARGGELSVHHLLHPRLWTVPGWEGGDFPDNGVTLCSVHHAMAVETRIMLEELRRRAGIAAVLVPPSLGGEERYDHWGNAILPNGTRLRGELFEDDDCQRALAAGGALGLFTHFVKQFRIPHLPWSEGVGPDDLLLGTAESFAGREVVVLEKLDGENCSMYRDHIHARSLGEMHHPSQSRVKAFHASVAHEIPERWRVVLENLSAEHTFGYRDLESLFPVTSIWNERNVCLSFDETAEYAALLGLPTAPVLYRGAWDERAVRGCYVGTLGAHRQEGYVVRLADAFPYAAARRSVAKFVSAEFRDALAAALGVHWASKPVVWNRRRPDSPWAA